MAEILTDQIPVNRHERRAAKHGDVRRGLTVDDFCDLYRVGKTFTYALIKAGEIEARKAGTRTIITVDSAERWFASLGKLDTSKAA